VAVVNQSFVDEHFPGEDPIGRRAGPDTSGEGPWYTIIGIVEDEWTSTENDNPAIAYASLYQGDARFLSLAARTRGEPMEITQAVRSLVMDIDPNMPIYWVFPMTKVIQDRTWFYTIFGGLMVTAGVLALFMAAVGLYGVMAFSVSRRTRELGVRMALGAQPGRVRSMILRQGAWQLGLGLAIGLGLAVLASSAMQLLLFGVQPSDPVVYALIITVLVATGFVACLVPARRATRVDPVSVLNTE
ncbi:FtsX-like permease family protein, partial [Gemmatimonadota bacterium]